jgi:pimeloyl-ACP methyl ester carboxylesterase
VAAGADGVINRLEVTIDGLTFGARASGPSDGRPVILLHGFPQTSWAWSPVLRALERAGYRAVAPDQRGYSPGARPPLVEDYALPRLIGDVLGLADALEMPVFDLVGHDWGGFLAWMVAARYPDRVRSLTVLSTPHPVALRTALLGGDVDQIERAAAPIALFRQVGLPEQLLLGEGGDGEGLHQLFDVSGLSDYDVTDYVDVLTEPGALTAVLNWYRAMDSADVGTLPQVTVPTLYVWSTGDAALGRAAAEDSAKYVNGPYQFTVLDDLSHWIPEEAPSRLVELLLSHLANY